jgi:putative ABC transport system ATP-binding protein
MPILQANDLKKEYQLGSNQVDVLAGVDFLVEKGEFLAIMGPSGSGKSTLLHMIGGLDQPSGGEIFLAGARLSQMKDKKVTLLRRRNIGFVFQFFNLLPTLSAEENITLFGSYPIRVRQRTQMSTDAHPAVADFCSRSL